MVVYVEGPGWGPGQSGAAAAERRGAGRGWWIAESLQSCVSAFPLLSGALLPGQAQPCPGLSCGPPEGAESHALLSGFISATGKAWDRPLAG